MSIITVYADQTTNTDTIVITLDKKVSVDKKVITGSQTKTPVISSMVDIVQQYEDRGYTFNGESDCKLYFVKYETVCDYEGRATETANLINNGYTLESEENCTLTYTKEGFESVVIILDSEQVIVDEVVLEGQTTSSDQDQVIVEGTPTTFSSEDLVTEGYKFEGIVDGKKMWSKEISYVEFDNKLKTIAELERKGYTLISQDNNQMTFSRTVEKCEVENKIEEVRNYEKRGYTLVSEEDCRLHFQKNIEALTSTTDVYAFFDTTSMKLEDGKDASAALKKWFAEYRAEHPDYKGQLFVIPIYYERYLDYLDIIKTGTAASKKLGGSPYNGADVGDEWKNEVAIYPPHFDNITMETTNPKWVAPTDVLMLAFVDEVNSEYHSGKPNRLDSPTEVYKTDYAKFVENVGNFNFFKAVLYPIVRDKVGEGGALVLQAMAAIEGKIMTQSEILSTRTKVDVSPLLTQNPYSTMAPLSSFGWIGVYDKVSPASDVFNSSTFSKELNEVIINGSLTLDVEDVYVEGTSKSYTDEITVESSIKNRKEYIYEEGCEIELTDKDYFEDASFTVGYSPLSGSWISYYSFLPNYYINQIDHFKTGLNRGEGGLWSHLLTNKSFQVFYGKKQPWVIELPIKEQYVNKTLKDIEYYLDAKKNSGAYDYAEVRNEGFNKAWVYNNRNASGELNLIAQRGLTSLLSKYPKTISDTQQEILYSDTKGKHRFNYFFNRVKDDMSSQPIWKWDINQIHKNLNPEAISFKGKRTLEHIRGDWFLVRLQQDIRTDLRYEFKWLTSSETINQ